MSEIEFVVPAHVAGGADEVHVAADAGEILAQLGEHAARRVLVVVERVVDEAVADERDDRGSGVDDLLHRGRGFAVEIAVVEAGIARRRRGRGRGPERAVVG